MKNVTLDNFDAEVLQSETPVVVDFWAPWCGPCRALAPHLEALSVELEGKVKIVKVNVDDEHDLAQKFKISSIPTLMVFKAGKNSDSLTGPNKTDATALIKGLA